jgi:hypothetical protein
MTAPLGWWDGPLQKRRGASERLCGITVFHDFRWRDVFPDQRTQFVRGQQLARTVIDQCPTGLTPGLVLTRREDVDQCFHTTDDGFFLFVLNIDEWVTTRENAALSYLASHSKVAPPALGAYAKLADLGGPEEVRAFIERELDVEHVAEWLAGDAARVQRLAELVDLSGTSPATFEHALDVLGAFEGFDEAQVRLLIDFVMRLTDDEQRHDLLRGVTEDKAGRTAAREVLGERLEDRVADARAELAAYKALVNESTTTETQMQEFLAAHPLLFGLEYVSVSPAQAGPSGSMDFVLERIDGYSDVIELKGPNEEIISVSKPEPSRGSPSPHTYKLSPALAQAIAQAMAYRDRLTRFSRGARELQGIAYPREPRLIIVLGRRSAMEKHQRRVLKELNRSLHRAEVVPYDLIAKRAKRTLDNIVTYLGSS